MDREAHLEPMLVGDITGRFYVPAYQRGYRWGEVEVRQLLDDIWESRDKAYYLQPVVVKKFDKEWELVDGQQRLTTLFLIFSYMQREGLQNTGAGYSLRYETREGSAGYLEAPDPELSQQNIDYFHIFRAYNCIKEWFEKSGHRRQFVANEFYGALFQHVQVIWYEAPDDVDANALFRRLNVGRIPLTDAGYMDQGSATTAVPKIGHIEWGYDDRPCQADDSPFSDDRVTFRSERDRRIFGLYAYSTVGP